MECTFSAHALAVLLERQIELPWAHSALNDPERVEDDPDGTVHYLRRIEAFGNRWLRVVVNPDGAPARVVTVFFDRRVR